MSFVNVSGYSTTTGDVDWAGTYKKEELYTFNGFPCYSHVGAPSMVLFWFQKRNDINHEGQWVFAKALGSNPECFIAKSVKSIRPREDDGYRHLCSRTWYRDHEPLNIEVKPYDAKQYSNEVYHGSHWIYDNSNDEGFYNSNYWGFSS